MSTLPWIAPPAAARLVIAGPGPGGLPLASLERDWKRLQRIARPANPFLTFEWQAAWAATHPDGARPLIAAEMHAEGGLTGLLALQRVRRRGLLHVEFLAQGAGGDELDCLLHPDAMPGVAERLWAAALAHRGWDLLRLESQRTGSEYACTAGLPDALPCPGEQLPWMRLPQSFDEFLAGHSSNFRSEVRRRRRALFRSLPDARLECAQTAAAVGDGLEHLFRLHRLRRRQKGGRGIFTAPMRAFHRRAAEGLASVNIARLYLLRTPDAVVATLYGFQTGERFFYYQSGFDPAFSELSPGTVLLSAVIEDCITRGLAQFEFLRGEEGYKSRWTPSRRGAAALMAAGSPAGRAYLALRGLRRRFAGEQLP